MNSATRAGAGEPPPLSTASHHPFVDKSLTRLPKTLGGVVPSGESCLCSRGPEGVGVTHLSGLFFSSQRRDAEQRRARESGLCPQGWAQLQCAAGGTEDKTWDSGCCCVSSVVRRPPHVGCREKKAKRAAFFLRCSFVRSVDFVGRPRASSKLVGPRTARPSSSISFREGLLSRAGGRGRMWVRVGVAPRPRLCRRSHSCSATRLRESALQLTEAGAR